MAGLDCTHRSCNIPCCILNPFPPTCAAFSRWLQPGGCLIYSKVAWWEAGDGQSVATHRIWQAALERMRGREAHIYT